MTPPNLEDIFNQNFGDQPEVPETREDITIPPIATEEGASRKTLEELQSWAENITTSDPNARRILDRIIAMDLEDDSITIDSYRTQIQSIFGTIHNIPEEDLSSSLILIQRHLNDVEVLYQAYLDELAAIGRDSEIRRGALAPAEYSDETALVTSPFVQSIREAFEETEDMNNNAILREIIGIEVSRSITLEDIDSHFNDLLNTRGLSADEYSALESFINEYKENSIFYESLERGEEVDLSEINDYLDERAREIIDSPDASPFIVTLEGDEWEFESQREALLTIYQLKLHLNEMEPYMIPYFFEQYAGLIASGIGIIGSLLVTIGGPFLAYKYVKNRLNDQLGRINEGLSREDLNRFTNSEGTGILDETLRGFQEDGFTDESIQNLRSLAAYLRSQQVPPSDAANIELLRANSQTYRQFARFRGRIGYLVSNIYRINTPLGEHVTNGATVTESPFRPRNLIGLMVGSVNRGPDGWQLITQRQVFERYLERFREFNSMIAEIDRVMETQGIGDEARGIARQEVRRLFVRQLTIPALWPNRVYPFRNRFSQIENILERHGVDTTGSDVTLLRRRVRGEIIPEIRDRINHIRTIIEYHPDITDANERSLTRRIDWLQHSENIGDFNDGLNQVLNEINIEGLESHGNIRGLSIANDLRISTDDLLVLKRQIPVNAPNKTNIDRYLSQTTAGHKGLIYLNIARIMRGENPLERISLIQASSIAEGFRHTDLSQIGRRLHDEYREIVLPEGGTDRNPTPEPEAREEVGTAPRRGIELYFDGENLRQNAQGRALYAVSFETGIPLTELRTQIPDNGTPAQVRDAINIYLTGRHDYRMETSLSADALKSIQIDFITRAALANGTDLNVDLVARLIGNNFFETPTRIGEILSINTDNVPSWNNIDYSRTNLRPEQIDRLREVSRSGWSEPGITRWRAILDAVRRSS